MDPFYDEKELFMFGQASMSLDKILQGEEIEDTLKLYSGEELVAKLQMRIEIKQNDSELKYVLYFDNLEVEDIEGLENKKSYFQIKCKSEPHLNLKQTEYFQLVNKEIPLELEIPIELELNEKMKQIYTDKKMKVVMMTDDVEMVPKMGYLPSPSGNQKDDKKESPSIPHNIQAFKNSRNSMFEENKLQSQRLSKNMCLIM